MTWEYVCLCLCVCVCVCVCVCIMYIRIRFYWPSKFPQTRNLSWYSGSQCAYTKYTLQHNTKQTVQRSKKFEKYIQSGIAIYSSCEMLNSTSAKKKWLVQEVQG